MTTDCRQRWRAKCNHVRTGGLLTTPPPTTMIMPESNTTTIVFTTSVTTIARLNFGIRNWQNYDLVNHADSGDIKVSVPLPGNSISKFSRLFENAWVALICENVSFSKSYPLRKRRRKILKMDFRFSFPRKLVRVWYH